MQQIGQTTPRYNNRATNRAINSAREKIAASLYTQMLIIIIDEYLCGLILKKRQRKKLNEILHTIDHGYVYTLKFILPNRLDKFRFRQVIIYP